MKKRKVVFFLLSFLGIFSFGMNAQATDYYVDASQTNDSGDGAGWETAKKYLQSALSLATDGDTIYVAEGIYYPDEGGGKTENDETASFTPASGVAIYGGYPTGGGTRNWETNTTTLSGDIGVQGNDSDNTNELIQWAYSDVSSSTVLDGFTVKEADAGMDAYASTGDVVSFTMRNFIFTENTNTGIFLETYNGTMTPTIENVTVTNNSGANGAGIRIYCRGSSTVCSPSFSDSTISNNTASNNGGGLHITTNNWAGTVAPSFTDCSFTENSAGDDGGGFYSWAGSGNINAEFNRVVFSGNEAVDNGGGISMNASMDDNLSTFTNCLITGNNSDSAGGALTLDQNNNDTGQVAPTFTNCTISGNKASWYGAIYGSVYRYETVNATFKNTIVYSNGDTPIADDSSWAHLHFSYSNVEGSGGSSGWDNAYGEDDGNNIDEDPLFTTELAPANAPSTSGDFHISDSSLCKGAGTSTGAPTTDYDELSRSDPPSMGAFEGTGNSAPSVTTPSSISQANDSSGEITFEITLTDTNDDTSTLKIEYSDDDGSNWYDPELESVSGDGSPNIDNTEEYQIRDISNTSGGNNLTIVWDTKSSNNENGSLDNTDQSDIKIRVTPHDGTVAGNPKTSDSFSLDNIIEPTEIESPEIVIGSKKTEMKKGNKIYSKKDCPEFEGEDSSLANGKVKIYKEGKKYASVQVDSDGKWDKDVSFGHNKTYDLEFKFYDSSNNLLGTEEYEIKIDKEDPVFESFPVNGNSFNRGENVNFLATDNHKIKRYKTYFNGKNRKTKNNYFKIPENTPPGNYNLKVKAYDKSGNKTTKEITIKVN